MPRDGDGATSAAVAVAAACHTCMRFEDENVAAWLNVCPATMQPAQRSTTAAHQSESISYEGRSKSSKAWIGGAAYAVRCGRCGLEPARPGFVSKCLCTCTQCFQLLNGKKVCPSRFCGHNQPVEGSGIDDGRTRSPETVPIATVHVKAKRCRPVAKAAAAAPVVVAAVDAVVVDSDDDDFPKCLTFPARHEDADAVVVSDDDDVPKCFTLPGCDDESEYRPKCFSLPSPFLS